jgi:hypothetical protein
MTSTAQPTLDPAPSSGSPAWRSPIAIVLAAGGFIAAVMSGMALSSWLLKGDAGSQSASTVLASSSLPLIHAQDEAERFQQEQLSSQDQELSVLKKEVDSVNLKLQDLTTRLQESQAKLALAEKGAGDAQKRKTALIAEKDRLDKLLADIRTTEAESAKAAKAIQMASTPEDLSGLPPGALDDWEKEWKALAADAETKVQAAKLSLDSLKKKHVDYESRKDSLSQAEKTQLAGELKSLNSETQAALKSAREAAPKATTALQESITSRRKLLEAAIQKAEQ